MKKIFTLSAFISLTFFAFSQSSSLSAIARGPSKDSGSQTPKIPVTHFHQAPPFFTEDFSSGIPGSWTNVDNSGNNVLWRATTTGAVNNTAPVDPQLNTVG